MDILVTGLVLVGLLAGIVTSIALGFACIVWLIRQVNPRS